MNNLELKDVLPYLPHEILCEILNYKSDYTGVQYGRLNGYYLLNKEPHFTYEKGSTGKPFNLLKFFMYPHNYLTQVIIHKGKKLTPLVELAKIALPEYWNDDNLRVKFLEHTQVHLVVWRNNNDVFFFGYDLIKKGFFIFNTAGKKIIIANQAVLFDHIADYHIWLGDQSLFQTSLNDLSKLEL